MGTIAVLDSDLLFLDCLIKAIRVESNHKVVGGTDDFITLYRYVKDYTPDFAIITLATHDVIEIEQIVEIHRLSPQTRLILLSRGIPQSRLKELINLGANGYFNRRRNDMRHLLHAIDEVEQNRRYIDPTLLTREQLFVTALEDHNKLTPRERDILPMLVNGESNKVISLTFGITIDTVKTHVSNICHKMGATSRKKIPAKAMRLGLISTDNLSL